MTLLRNYYVIFNNIFSTLLILSCLSETSEGDKCGSIISDYSKKLLPQQSQKDGASPLQTGGQSHQKSGPHFGLDIYLFEQNKGLLNPLNSVQQNIWQVLPNSDDISFNNLLNSNA